MGWAPDCELSSRSPHRSKWVPLGDYISSNTDECTATLMYAVNLKQSGTVNFEYYYPDSSIIFEFFVSPWPKGKWEVKTFPGSGSFTGITHTVLLGKFPLARTVGKTS